MKRTILILLLMGFSQVSFCQYKSVFGKDSTQWNVILEIPDYFPTDIFRIHGDTVKNGINYKILFRGNHWHYGEKYGYLREDTTLGKLWFLSLDNKEQLYMNLSLKTLDTFIFNENIKYVVDRVFSKNGKKYLAFNNSSRDSILFMEGIGPSYFLFPTRYGLPTYAQIRCMFKDNLLVYKNVNYTGCIDTIVSVSENQIQHLNVFPNPTSGMVTFSFNGEKPVLLELYNNVGILVHKQRILKKYIYDISPNPSGVYIVRYTIGSKIFTSKLLKL